MKKEELEKHIGELSPELQEKARACKDMKELNALLAENDVELSDDALEAVAGGCGGCDHSNAVAEKWWFIDNGTGEPYLDGIYVYFIEKSKCTKCGGNVKYIGHKHSPGNLELTEAQYNYLKNNYTFRYCE